MRTVKMIFRLCCATTIVFLFGLLPMSFRRAELAPTPRIDQYEQSCPTANFTSSGSVSGAPTQFTNLSTLAESYSWDFGDGSGSTETNPQHTYAAPGSYQVRLTAYGDGCEVSFIGTVDVVL